VGKRAEKPRVFFIGSHRAFVDERRANRVVSASPGRFETDGATYIHVSRSQQLRGVRLLPVDSIKRSHDFYDLANWAELAEESRRLVMCLRDPDHA
jgi:hypothetical protein